MPRGSALTNGRAEALDFAVTSGMRADRVEKAISNPEAIHLEHESFKRGFKDTKDKCVQEGVAFTPVVFEAHGGGFSAVARRLYDQIAKQQASAGLSCKEGLGMRIAQRISTAIHVANSRAILKRLWQGMPEPKVFDLEAADALTDSEDEGV